jgi:hypothetical protein
VDEFAERDPRIPGLGPLQPLHHCTVRESINVTMTTTFQNNELSCTGRAVQCDRSNHYLFTRLLTNYVPSKNEVDQINNLLINSMS